MYDVYGRLGLALVLLVTIPLPVTALADQGQSTRTSAEIIRSYVEGFRSDRFASETRLFGIDVPGQGEWHVQVTGERTGDTWGVELSEGPPPSPTFVYRIEEETLRLVDGGALNAITAQGKAFASDYAPMDVIEMEGRKPSPEEYAAVNPLSFHFWTRGFPEVIPFGGDQTRTLHGSPVVGFYYETGLRTAYSRIDPGGQVRDDPRE
jgi:hypothetical protein